MAASASTPSTPSTPFTPFTSSVSTTLLHVPDMCCAGEYRAVEAQLRQLAGVRDIAPNYAQRLIRVRHGGLGDAVLLDAAKASGFAVNLATPAP